MTAYELDHLAIAVPDWQPPTEYLVERLGGVWKHGFVMPEFNPAHLAFAGDMRIELLAPGSDQSSFIRRYLDGSGGCARPHHITFKVKDIDETLAAVRAAGLEPIQLRLDNDVWREGFLHPKDTGLGFLAQFVEAEHDPGELESSDPLRARSLAWLPAATGEAVRIPFLLGRLPGWGSVRRVLVDVLGAVASDLEEGREGGVTWSTTRFSWDEGADLILTTHPGGAVAHGIEGIGVLAGDEWRDAEHRRLVDAGEFVEVLGVTVAEVG